MVFSYGFPYASLELEKFLNKLTHKKLTSTLIIDKIKVCETLSGFPIYVYHLIPKKSNQQKQSQNSHTNFVSTKSFNMTSTVDNFFNDSISLNQAIPKV